MLSEQQQRIMGYFIEEAKDHLNTIEQGLVNLQSTIADSEMVHEVFRAAHSVKGGAAMLGLNSIQHTAHRLEDYFKVLKECPQVRVDQKLETLFLRVYDTLQDQVDHLQGPFGLTDDKAQEAMATVEPVFAELNQHLILLVNQAGGTPPEDVELVPMTVAQTAQPQPQVPQPVVAEESALRFIFQNDVPARLREMLQLFKQAESATNRQQLQDLCLTLAQPGEQFGLANWCDLLQAAQHAIGNIDHPYRTLAPVIIKDIKRSQELILSGRSTEISPSQELLALLPPEPFVEEEPEADLVDFLGAIDSSDQDLPSMSALTDEDSAIDSDAAALIFAEEGAESEKFKSGWLAETSIQDEPGEVVPQNGHTAEFDFDLGFEQIASVASHSTDLDLDFIDQLDNEPLPEIGERNGPEVGAAELNSLADLFEGELPDLGLTWQEEEVINLPASDSPEAPLENSGDFFDLLDQNGLDELALDEAQEDDLSGLLNAAALQANYQADSESLSFSTSQGIPTANQRETDLPPDFEPPDPVAPDEMAMFFFADAQANATIAASSEKSTESSSGFQNLDDLFAGIEVEELATGDSSEVSEISNQAEAETTPTPFAAIELNSDSLDPESLVEDGFADLFESEPEQVEASPLAHIEAEELESFSNFLSSDSASAIGAEAQPEDSPDLFTDQLFAEASVPSEEALSTGIESEAIENEFFADSPEALPEEIQEGTEDNLPELWLDEPENEISLTKNDASSIEDAQDLTAALADLSLEDSLLQETIADSDLSNELDQETNLEFDALDIFFTEEDVSEVAVETNSVSAVNGDDLLTTDNELTEFDFNTSFLNTTGSTEVEIEAEQEPATEVSSSLFEETLAAEFDFEEIVETAEVETGVEDAASTDFSFDALDDVFVSLPESIDESTDPIAPAPEAFAADLETVEPELILESSLDINSLDINSELTSFESNGALILTQEEISAEHAADLGLESLGFFNSDTASSESIDSDVGQEDFADLEFMLAEDAFVETDSQSITTANLSDDDEFADLEAMLGDDLAPLDDTSIDTPVAISAIDISQADNFADLEALLEEDEFSSSPPTSIAAVAANSAMTSAKVDDEFGDLEALLQDTDQKLGVGSSPVRNSASAAVRRPNRRNVITDQTMRVSVKHLDNLNNLVGEMVVNRNSLEQTQERLRQFLDNLLYQVQQLNDVGQRMRDLYERSLLESSLLASRRSYQISGSSNSSQTSHATGVSFDALEMDKFTGFHTLSQEMIELIVRVRESASDIDFVVEESDQVTRNFRQITTQLQEGLTRSRMVPFAQTADRLPRGVRDNAIKYGKQAELHIEGRDTLIDKMIVEQLYDPMTHLVNNAIAHGIETSQERIAAGKSPTGRIIIRAFHQGNQTVISVSDDGAGIDTDAVKAKAVAKRLITAAEAAQMSRLEAYDLLFHHGFSTADTVDDLRGRGVGLDVVRNNLSEIRGSISIDSAIGKGSTFTIRLPLTLSISKALCCISNRARIAFPMDGVEDMLDVPKERVYTDDEGRPCIQWRDALLPFQPLAELLKYNRVLGRGSVYGGNQEDDMLSIVVLRSAGNYLALQVDQVLGEQEIVIKQLEGPVPKPIGVAGATVLGDGRIMPIADVLELIDLSQGRIRRETGNALWDTSGDQSTQDTAALKTDPTVLIVDDSITVRELLSMTFNKVGYRVEQARDGQEAWEKLRSGLPCDLVFCDIEMPRMDGLELLSRLQKDPHLCHIPIAMLTSRGADRHRQMAVQLGAKGYFTKPYLEEMLLDAAQRMLKGEVLVTSTSG